MKRNLLGMCLVALLACAGTASADVLAEDSAANYTEESFVNGANLGSGFGAWAFWGAAPALADSTAGLCGDVNSENGVSFRFARDGGNEWCNGYRGFEALNVNDTLSFRFTCAYCGGGRGLDLFANGGHEDSDKIANVIHLSGDNEFSVNGTVISTEWATNTVTTVVITQEADGISIGLARVPADEGGAGNVAYLTKVETDKKLTGIGIYAGGWGWEDGKDVENYAFYVNDLKIEGEPPTDTLTLAGAWEVTGKEAELPFKVTRQNSEGTLDVALVSSYPEFASVPNLVTIADGDTEVSFTVTATLQGRGNVATISASAEGVTGASFEVKGPNYRVNNGSETPVSFLAGESADIWINWDGGARDDSKLALTAEPEDVISVPSDWTLPAEGDVYVQSSVTALAPGDAALVLSYDGIEMARCDFTVLPLGFELSGPPTAKTGDTKTYTLKATLDGSEEGCIVTVTPEGAATVDPASFDLTDRAEDGFYYWDISVTFNQPGDVTLSVASPNYSSDIKVTVSDPVDPSKFDDFVAYDEASLYGDSLDYAAVGAGTDKFQAWTEVVNNNNPDQGFYAGAIIVKAAPDEAVLSDGSAFALYSNGGTEEQKAEIKLRRPFVNSLSAGQAFSVQISPNYRDGAKGVVLQGEWEGNWYDRVEFYCSGESYAYKINGGESVDLGWAYGAKLIAMTLQCAADGSSYTLSFSREGDSDVTVENLTFEGSVDGALFYSWNGGNGDENNFVFNRLAIEQIEEPIVTRAIGWGEGVYEPEGDGTYTITLTATTTDIGEVAIAVEPADGALSLESDTVDLTGVTSATITYTLTGANAGDSFRISATPADTDVAPLTGEGAYGVTVSGSYLTLWCDDGGDFTTDTTNIWMSLSASPSKYGTYTIVSSDPSVIEPSVSSLTLPNGDGNGIVWFDVFVRGVGNATVSIEGEEANWEFHIAEGSGPAAKVLPITGNPSISGKAMTLTVDGTPAAVYGATEIAESNWVWQPIEGATIDGDKVTIDMTGIPYLIIKVEK